MNHDYQAPTLLRGPGMGLGILRIKFLKLLRWASRSARSDQ